MKANIKILLAYILFWSFIYSCIALSGCSSVHKNYKTSTYKHHDGFATCPTYN